MKLQLKIDQLPRLDLAGSIRLLATNAKKIEANTSPEPALIFAEHQYPDAKLKGKLMPLFLIGEYDNDWKKEYNDRKTKDAAMGQCTIKGTVLEFEMLEGKALKSDAIKELEAIARQARLEIKIIEKSAKSSAGAGANVDAPPVNTNSDAPADKVEQVKQVVNKHAEKLTELLDGFREQFNRVKNTVIPNLQADKASRSDLLAVRAIFESMKNFEAIYDKTHKSLKTAFGGAKETMDAKKGFFAKLAKKVKEQKKPLAKQLADVFYNKNKGRPATEDETTIMHENIKMAMEHHGVAKKKGEDRQNYLKAIYATAQYRGAYFSMDDTEKVYEKLAE